MAKIHLLDKAVAELIAAGEVVERPASIAKELLENAVDAGATKITVEIKGGGIRYLRVSDNGCGIAREDIPTAFLRHATSKVQTADDLGAILTMGFRGEALASIAAISRVELTSKTREETEGTTCRIQGGEHLDSFPAGCPTGTTIVVEDVFYNTPARMKFLKKDITEGNSVAQAVDKCALSHPEISFRFIRDGQTKLQTSGGGDLLSVIRTVYGREMAGQMIPVDDTSDKGIRVHGYISAPGGARPSRTYQNFFINSRYVRTRTAGAALEEGFKHKLMGGKYPACVLHLELDPSTVDVNVHPAKIEVRFADEKPIFHAVYFAVKSALAKLDAPLDPSSQSALPQPKAPPPAAARTERQQMTAQEFQALFDNERGAKEPAFSQPVSLHSASKAVTLKRPYLDISVDSLPMTKKEKDSTFSDEILPENHSTIFGNDAAKLEKNDTISMTGVSGNTKYTDAVEDPLPLVEEAPLRFIGEFLATYILLEQGEDLLLVDKHAAHERILYEQLKENLQYGNRQVLLEACAVTLSRDDYSAVLEHLDKLSRLGFGVEDFGDGTVLVRETPIELPPGDIPYVIAEIADKLRKHHRDLTPEVLDRLYYSIACRSAIKAHDKNQAVELEEIVHKLRQNPDITHCPHGRPVCIRMGKGDIEKKFGRLG